MSSSKCKRTPSRNSCSKMLAKSLSNCGVEDRNKDLVKKNDEYSQMIQRLINTVEAERDIYEKRIREMTRASEAHIRR